MHVRNCEILLVKQKEILTLNNCLLYFRLLTKIDIESRFITLQPGSFQNLKVGKKSIKFIK